MPINDLTDIRPDGGANNPNVSPTTLPIRGEKRIITTPITPETLSDEAMLVLGGKARAFYNTGRTSLVQASDFETAAALEPFVDYVIIRIPHRGVDASGTLQDQPAVYRFLINPATVQINRTTIDGQAFTRAGWQIGVWGEDSLQITMSGQTAGQYFAFGIADIWQPYTESYRNLQQLQVVFENNGYWFEGEQLGEGPLGAGFGISGAASRRRIKMHADVELIVGNYVWEGMFDTLSVQQSAESPFYMNYSLSFIAWKERFRSGSPYPDTLHNDVQRGHAYDSWAPTALMSLLNPAGSTMQQNAPVFPSVSAPLPVLQQPGTTTTPMPGAPNIPVSPTVQSAMQNNTACTIDGTTQSADQTGLLLNPSGWSNFINGGR
jgi:hypothetical protein